jgi:hypothetical protein
VLARTTGATAAPNPPCRLPQRAADGVSPGFVATEPERVRFHNRSILILVQKIQSRLKGFQCMSELQPQQELQLSLRLHWSTSRTGGHYVSAGVGVADIYELGIHWESTAGGESSTQFLILWETLRAFMKKIVDASMP